MRRFNLLVTALLLMTSLLFAHAPNGIAQEKTPFGMAVIDVTFSSDCAITNRTYATLDIESEIVDEQDWNCPAGTVIRSTPVDSMQEAIDLGGIFVPLTGNVDADFSAVESAKAQLLPTDTRSYGLEQTSASSCTVKSMSKSFSYWANVPGVRTYSTVYFWQDYDCDQGISSARATLSWNADFWWRQVKYSPPYWLDSHGCVNLSTGYTWDTYNKHINLGGLYQDESINDNSWGCTGFGDSYTGSVYL